VSRPLPFLLLALIAFSGCATTSPDQKAKQTAAKEASKTIQPSGTSVLRPLSQRINNPDMAMTFFPGDRGYAANQTFNGKPAYVKDFYVHQKPYVKSFDSKPWWGTKSDRQTEKSYKTKEARTKDYRTEQYTTEDYRTKDWYYAKKATAVNVYDTPDYAGRGTRQDEFDRQNATAKAMTIDDVRALLNKNE
jgi:hypothetical protein